MIVAVVFESRTPDGWAVVGRLANRPSTPLGSISSEPPNAPRQVFLFGWQHGIPGVWRSLGGIDTADSNKRRVETVGTELLGDLRRCSYLSEVHSRSGPVPVRWRLDAPDLVFAACTPPA